MTFRELDEVAVGPRARVYTEGWQSWSPTTWYHLDDPLHRPRETWQHLMRFRPGTELPDDGFQGEGLLVVDPGDGRAVRVYGQRDAAESVASIRARRHGDHLVVSTDAADDEVAVHEAPDPTQALTTFGAAFAGRAGAPRTHESPRVWCSWYRYFEDVTASDVRENLWAFDDHDLPVDVVQVDDGWAAGTGDWLRPRESFGSLDRLVDDIRATGRRAGIWVAPFVVGRDSDLARSHPDWLVGPAGYNWGQDLAGLDVTRPEVRRYLEDAFRRLRGIGIDYFKIDFVYAGAVPGPRHDGSSPVAAYRSGLALVREAIGPESYLVGCGAPILPSVGLVDAMRVSPDTFHVGAQDGSDGLRGQMSLEARTWQHGRFWVNDPDCLVARPEFPLRREWADVVSRHDGLRSFSDRVAELDPWGLETTRRVLAGGRPPAPTDVTSPGPAGARTAPPSGGSQ